jgi:hypothetical protein
VAAFERMSRPDQHGRLRSRRGEGLHHDRRLALAGVVGAPVQVRYAQRWQNAEDYD